MIRTLTLVALVAVANWAPAQTAPTRQEPLRGKAAGDVYEDIEVLRRLFLAGLHTTQGNEPFGVTYNSHAIPEGSSTEILTPDGKSTRSNAGGAYYTVAAPRNSSVQAEGVYLDGKGVIFSITLPMSARDPMPTTGEAGPTRQSDWQRTLKQVRGEKAEAANASKSLPPSTSDIILKLLADNGMHLRVSDREEVTVAVTFRVDQASVPFVSSFDTNYGRTLAFSDFPMNFPGAQLAKPTEAPTKEPSFGHAKSAYDFELIGDLHMRQKQYKEAAGVYAEALKKFPEQTTVDLYRKTAEAYMQLGRFEEAKSIVELAQQQKAKPAKPKSAPNAPSAPLPGKLIITVSKRALDDVGQGKMSLDAFKKGAKIDYFPGGDRKAKD